MNTLTQKQFSEEELRQLRHPTEDSRFDLALIVVVIIASFLLFLIFLSYGSVLITLAFIIGLVWIALQISKAHFTSNTLKVSPRNFPQIYQILQEVKHVLDYNEPISAYIVEDGTVNAFLAKFFRTKFIILNSELVKNMLEEDTKLQLKWVVARFIGGLKIKHDKFSLARIIIDSTEKLKIFNLLLLPYERSIHYSADQIGLVVCGDLKQALLAFQKFMVGNDLAIKIDHQGILEQKQEMGFFAAWARLFSSHPHVVDRYINLLSFAQEKYPAIYKTYIDSK